MKKRGQSEQLQFDFAKFTIREFKIDFMDESLFGSDDAAHVDFELLQSYSIEKTDCEKFLDEKKDFMVLCAPKGTGKTTLVRLWQNTLSKKKGHISVLKYDSQISPSIDSLSYSTWIRYWKRQITFAIYLTLTNNKYYGVQAKDFKFIETVEFRGKKRLNLIELITEHLLLTPTKLPDEAQKILLNKDIKIWVFLDEIDQYFTQSRLDILKMASMLTACRELTSYIANLHIRTTIKPNVWAILRTEESSMSNINELVVGYTWTTSNIKSVIAKRVQSYIIRNYENEANIIDKSVNFFHDQDWLISQIFDSDMDFDLSYKNRQKRDFQKIPPEKTLAMLGSMRPRWVLSLCKQVAESKPINADKINMDHINNVLPAFGRERIKDIASEFKTQCDQISQIMNSFFKEPSNYSNLNYLLEKINSIIIKKHDVRIAGISDRCTAKDLAKFLFEIGFIQPKNYISSRKSEFIEFENFPTIIDNSASDGAINNELIWEIHPAYRDVLSLDRVPLRIQYAPGKK